MQPIKDISISLGVLNVELTNIQLKGIVLNNEYHYLDCGMTTSNAIETFIPLTESMPAHAACCPAEFMSLAEHLIPQSVTPALKALTTANLIDSWLENQIKIPKNCQNPEKVLEYILDITYEIDECLGNLNSALLKTPEKYLSKLEEIEKQIALKTDTYRNQCFTNEIEEKLKRITVTKLEISDSRAMVLFATTPSLREDPSDNELNDILQALLSFYAPSSRTNRTAIHAPEWVYTALSLLGGPRWLSVAHWGLSETQIHTARKLWSNNLNDLYFNFDKAVEAAVNL
ncbi:MAG: hypothetical protein ACKOW9_06515 [Candidatus Paceibacterota bacterium]